MTEVKSPKKLIEVALPLDAINVASANEKSIRHGHPSTLHLWWARRPLAAARAMIFAQLVNDPASLWEFQNPGQKPSQQQRGGFTQRRNYLFKLITDLVQWENTTNEEVLGKARAEIRESWREVCALNREHADAATLFDPDKLPGLHDPFAGGGTIPLEAQRLGLDAFASDLNPVAVLINKAMIEIPPKFAGRPPVHPDARREGALRQWKAAEGLAEDLRRYGLWMREEAERRIGHLYPKVAITAEMGIARPDLRPFVGRELPVLAWLWARTVKSPNPAFSGIDVPLVTTFLISGKAGHEHWVEAVVEGNSYRFEVRPGTPPETALAGTKAPGRGADFRCLLSGTAISGDYIKAEGQAGRMHERMLAIVADAGSTRVYLSPTTEADTIARSASPEWRPSGLVPARLTGGTCVPYGLREWGDIFSPRQLVALTTFATLVGEARTMVLRDAQSHGQAGGDGLAYADSVAVLLALSADRLADTNSTLCGWNIAQATRGREATVRSVFSRQAIPMVWDYVEVNVLCNAAGGHDSALRAVVNVVERLVGGRQAVVTQADARSAPLTGRFVSTDPPYYNNIGYADLSDFFYVWLRRSLRPVLPDLFGTIAVPKEDELVATPFRHGSKEKAEQFFLAGMQQAMERIAAESHPGAPITIYYAFKQSETVEGATSSTGWETFLQAVLNAGLAVTGTWPIRTERATRSVSIGTNSLASSIVLVCRKRPSTAATISRREFIRELNAALPLALDEMTRGTGDDQSPVAPVDLSQAIIGPGMAVFSKYAAVLEADGTPMTVKTALQLINRFLAEDDFDADTQFCLHWFEQKGWDEGAYGDADVLARAKATSVGGVDQAGVVVSGGGKVRLRRPADYPKDWDPLKDKRLPVWEALHQLVRAFRSDGESGAGAILAAVKAKSEAIRQLAYRLYTLCERRGWADDARGYNDLVTAWPAIETVANAIPVVDDQMKLFGRRP